MADYTTTDRVRTLCKRLPAFGATSTMTDTEVESLIDDHEAEINVALSKHGYAVPVTSPAYLATWLGKVATEGVAAAVLKSYYQDSSGPNAESAWSVWEKRYAEALKAIRADDMIPGVTDEAGARGVSSFATDYADDYEDRAADLPLHARPAFTKAMEW